MDMLLQKCSYQCVRELWAQKAWAWPRQLSCGFSKAVCMLMAETCREPCPGFFYEEMPDKPKLIDTAQNTAYKTDALKCREQETKREVGLFYIEGDSRGLMSKCHV